MRRACLSLLLCACCLPLGLADGAGWPHDPSWPPHSDPDAPPEDMDLEYLQQMWGEAVNTMWGQVSSRVSFCLGSSRQHILHLMEQSFPTPLPVGPPEDEVCGNATWLAWRLCGKQEIQEYYKYVLMTDNQEKLPNTLHCPDGLSTEQCEPGFFDAAAPASQWANSTQEQAAAHACCPGYFCPPMLTCMMPCPLGAFCPRAEAAAPHGGWAEDHDQKTRWCAPYAYKERASTGCGGADKWTIVPGSPFPHFDSWAFGSGNLYCNGGSFCPDTISRQPCPRGYFCRRGSTTMQRCPLLMKCPPGTEIPDDNHAGFTMDACLFLFLWLLWQLSTWYNGLMKRINLRARLKITAAPTGMLYESPQGAAQTVQLRSFQREDEGDSSPSVGLTSPPGGTEGDQSPSPEQRAPSPGAMARMLSRLSPRKLQRRAYAPLEEAQHVSSVPVWAGFEGPSASPGNLPPSLLRQVPPRGEDDVISERSVMSAAPNLMTSPLSSVHGGILPNRKELSVDFTRLGLRLKSTGKKVLAGVTASLRAACLTAIMGPSGAGKTTLMNALAGKAGYGRRTGVIEVNGQPDSLERYTKVMGFVPQDDVMYANMTVEENLLFSARYRLPTTMSHSQHLFFVERAIQVLQLEEVRGELVGDEEVRGISGGQRKRVNVGLELVADPLLLFLDEPTSGLDSTSSRLVMAALQQVARMGVTVTAVIHQPSHGIFRMFDDLLLLCKGGRTAYYGRQEAVQEYFEGLGYELPLHANPADVYMDIIAGIVLPTGPNASSSQDLPSRWEDHMGEAEDSTEAGILSDDENDLELSLQRTGALELPGQHLHGWRAALHSAHVAAMVGRAVLSQRLRLLRHNVTCLLPNLRRWHRGQPLLSQPSHLFEQEQEERWGPWRGLWGGPAAPQGRAARAAERSTPRFPSQLRWCLERAVLQRTREPLAAFLNYGIFAITGSLLGIMSDRGRGTIMHVDVDTLYNNVALGLLSTVSGLKTFGAHRMVFRREAASGLNKLAYFLSLDLLGSCGTLARALLYMVMYTSFAQPRAVLWQMYVVTAAVIYACMGTAYFLSQILEPAAGQLTAAVFALMSSLTARNHHGAGLMEYAYRFSFARWGLEDLQALDMDVTHFGRCILMLAIIGVMFRTFAIAVIYIRT